MVQITVLQVMDMLEGIEPPEMETNGFHWRWRRLRELLDAQLKANSAAARSLGSIKSEKKTESSRENGKKGGRPKKGSK